MGSLGSKPKDPGPSAQEQALAQRAVAEWEDYKQRFAPRERQFRDLLTRGQDSKIAQLEGEASASAAAGAVDEMRTARTGAILEGRNPNLAAAGLGLMQASATGQGASAAASAVKDRELKGLLKFSAFGRGLADQSNLGLRSAARDATQLALDKLRAEQTISGAQAGMLGNVLGGATAGLTLYNTRPRSASPKEK